MSLKFKLKAYFKTKDTSEHAVEFMRMFILPFMKVWNPDASIDAAVEAFFGMNDRKFFYGVARRDFDMPGYYMKAGNRPVVRSMGGLRAIVKGQQMLLAVDRRDNTARIDVVMNGKDCTFKLSRAELEFIKDYVDVKET